MKKFLIIALVSVCGVSCSSKKIASLAIELGNIETEIQNVKNQSEEEQYKITKLNREIEKLEIQVNSTNKGIKERQEKIEQLEQSVQKKKEDAAKPKVQSKTTGRRPNEAPAGYKRFEVDRTTGTIKY